MILRTSVRPVIYPENLDKQCSKAAHAVAIQAERDCRPYVPSKSGKLRTSGRVYGNTIVWNPPYARIIYFGTVYVDPKYQKGGFPYKKLGIIRSRRGVKKVRSGRKFHINRGESGWFYDVKRKQIGRWAQLAQEVIERG